MPDVATAARPEQEEACLPLSLSPLLLSQPNHFNHQLYRVTRDTSST
jgi:hypothetical protein